MSEEQKKEKGPETASTSAVDGAILAAVSDKESIVEANVQKTLDTFDAWKITLPFRGKDPSNPAPEGFCTQEKHNCDLDADNDRNICIGCLLYKKLVLQRSIFPVGGNTEVCDYFAVGIAEKLIRAFVESDKWLTPMRDIKGKWFIKHPLTFISRQQSAMIPVAQVALRRNKIHIFEGDALLKRMGISPAQYDSVYRHLRVSWNTEAGGMIYSLDELLDNISPLVQIGAGFSKFGIDIASLPDLKETIAGIQSISAEAQK